MSAELEAQVKVLERNNQHLTSLLDARQNEAFAAEHLIAKMVRGGEVMLGENLLVMDVRVELTDEEQALLVEIVERKT